MQYVVLFVFVELFTGGSATAAVLTLDTAIDGSREEMADGVWQSPRIGSALWQKTGAHPTIHHRLQYGFYFFFLAFCLSLFSFFSCCFVRAAVIHPASARMLFLSQPYNDLLASCVKCVVISVPCFIVFLLLFSCLVCSCVPVPGTLAFQVPLPVHSRLLFFCFFLRLTVCDPHSLYHSRMRNPRFYSFGKVMSDPC